MSTVHSRSSRDSWVPPPGPLFTPSLTFRVSTGHEQWIKSWKTEQACKLRPTLAGAAAVTPSPVLTPPRTPRSAPPALSTRASGGCTEGLNPDVHTEGGGGGGKLRGHRSLTAPRGAWDSAPGSSLGRAVAPCCAPRPRARCRQGPTRTRALCAICLTYNPPGISPRKAAPGTRPYALIGSK